MPHDVSTAEHNRQHHEYAVRRLIELLQQAQESKGEAKEIVLRIPVHGPKLGKPVGGLMTT